LLRILRTPRKVLYPPTMFRSNMETTHKEESLLL